VGGLQFRVQCHALDCCLQRQQPGRLGRLTHKQGVESGPIARGLTVQYLRMAPLAYFRGRLGTL
jgi:hypothetical protein